MEQIEAEKSKVAPVRPPRRPKAPKLPKIPTARVIPIIQPLPNRNPFDPPSPPIFRQTKHKESCASYLYTNEGILWTDKELSMCFIKPTPRAPPTPAESPDSTLPNSPFETRPSTPAIQRLLNDFFTEPNSRQESPVPPEDVAFVLDNLFQQQATRHPEAKNNFPFLFLNPAEVAPEADLPKDIWDLLENPAKKWHQLKLEIIYLHN